jgi:hypothetical protein
VSAQPSPGGNGRRDAVKQACTVLYEALPTLNAARLREDLEALVGIECEVAWAESTSSLPLTAGLARWDEHRVAMVAMDAPVSQEILARTVAVSPMPEDLRVAMAAHRAAIRLLYVGDDESPLGQLTALYQVAVALLLRDGLGVVNERAALAQPAELVLSYLPQLGGDPPPLNMWIGVVTYEREGEGAARSYLMRTYGLEQFGLPELAIYMASRSLADDTYHILLNVALYMVEGGPSLQMSTGHNVEFLNHTYLFTDPPGSGPEFTGPTGVLLLIEV